MSRTHEQIKKRVETMKAGFDYYLKKKKDQSNVRKEKGLDDENKK